MALSEVDGLAAQPLAEELNWYSSEGTVSWVVYEKLRPVYPREIYDLINDYMDRHNTAGREFCVDYGSGSGVVIPDVLGRCGIRKVLRTDLHVRQLEEGDANLVPIFGADRVESRVGAAGELGSIPDCSVDLVTAAESIQYFDQEKWFPEVARILKPSGTLAFWLYRPHCFIVSHPEAAPACNEACRIYFNQNTPSSPRMFQAGILSASLLDSVTVDPKSFSNQCRQKWLLPTFVSQLITVKVEYSFPPILESEEPITEAMEKAGLLAVPDTRLNESVPQTSQDILMKRTNWTTATLVQYLLTTGMPINTILTDEQFKKAIADIERVVGGPNGTFDVAWECGLVLATRR